MGGRAPLTQGSRYLGLPVLASQPALTTIYQSFFNNASFFFCDTLMLLEAPMKRTLTSTLGFLFCTSVMASSPPALKENESMIFTSWRNINGTLMRAITWEDGVNKENCVQVAEYTYGSYEPGITFSLGDCQHVYQRLPDNTFDPVISLPLNTLSKLKRSDIERLMASGDLTDGLPGDIIVLPDGAKRQ